MIALYYVAIVVLALSLGLTYYLLKKKNKNFGLFTKILMYLVAVAFFFRFMWRLDRLETIFELTSDIFESKFWNLTTLILNWFLYSSVLVIILYPFFKVKGKETLVKYFSLPITILGIIAFVVVAKGVEGSQAFSGFNLRVLVLAIELSLSLVVSLIVFIEKGYFKSEKADWKILLYLPILLLATMPPYILSGIFGYANFTGKIKSFTLYHRIILYIGFIIPVALYFLFRKKDKDTIRAVLLYISIGTLLSFSVNYKFPDFLDVTHWPFHLCNTAMYIVVLCLIFKWEKLFYFTYFINVLGALFAMFMPNYSDSINILSTGLVEFYINHYIAFFMPLLMVALRVFSRPKLKQFIYSMIGFAVYFLLVLIMNAWFSNYGSVDYFFVNSNFIADKLGKWAEDLRNNIWNFNIGKLSFTFYPVYQVLFFFTYVLLGLGVWFVYERAYEWVDTLYDISDRREKIKLDRLALDIALEGRSKEEPMDLESVNQIKLIEFSKRYGSSNVYAVKDASLTINSGEVFGFLGPNGAGKSTIIKSMVGIQPITSGAIKICGYDVDKQSVMAKRCIGFVPDHYALYEKLTGREYINYIADLYHVSLEDRNKTMDKYVNLFQLQDAFDNKMQTYSHGMKQKISIISALIHNPKVWILDEPLIGLDPTSIYQVKECIKEHAMKGNIVFFSSHLIDIVERVCDRIAIIKKGHILECKSVKEIEETTTVEQFYLDTIKADVRATKFSAEKEKIKFEHMAKIEAETEQVEVSNDSLVPEQDNKTKNKDQSKEKSKTKQKAKK